MQEIDRVQVAKRRYSRAIERYLSGQSNAAECERALAELQAARKEQDQQRRPRVVAGRQR